MFRPASASHRLQVVFILSNLVEMFVRCSEGLVGKVISLVTFDINCSFKQ